MVFDPRVLDGFDWSTAFVADACIALELEVRVGPPGMRPVEGTPRVAGAVRPAHHAGSVDVFLEAIAAATPGDILMIDNTGRLDEGCIGDLIVGEAKAAGLGGIIVWGAHRDSAAVRAIGLPVWSLGAFTAPPLELRSRSVHALEAASIGRVTVTLEDVVFADEDGIVFVAAVDVARVVAMARDIAAREQAQAAKLAGGERLRVQLQLDDYVARREADGDYTFREHLRRQGAAIEI